MGKRQRALVMVGPADPHYDAVVAEAVRGAIQGEVVVIEDAEHGLEVPGDVVRSVQALERALHAVPRFVHR